MKNHLWTKVENKSQRRYWRKKQKSMHYPIVIRNLSLLVCLENFMGWNTF